MFVRQTLGELASIMYEKGINAWVDFWGHDVYHDWPWWELMIKYFLPQMV